MLRQFVDTLLQHSSNEELLQIFRDNFDLCKFVNSPEYNTELSRLLDHNHYDGSVVDIIGDRSSIIIIDEERFTVSLSKRTSNGNYVYTQPAKTLIANLSSRDPVEIELYWADGIENCDPIEARYKKIEKVDSVYIEYQRCWIPTSLNTLFKINRPADNSIWLTIYGERTSHYFHAYSTVDYSHLFSAFSSHTVSSSYYLTEILYHAFKSIEASEHGIVERHSLARAARGLAKLPEMPVTGLWRIAEATSEVDPEFAFAVLREISLKGGAIGEKASRALAKLGHAP